MSYILPWKSSSFLSEMKFSLAPCLRQFSFKLKIKLKLIEIGLCFVFKSYHFYLKWKPGSSRTSLVPEMKIRIKEVIVCTDDFKIKFEIILYDYQSVSAIKPLNQLKY